MKIALTAHIRTLALRREDNALTAEVTLAGECEAEILNTLGVSSVQGGFWLLDTGALLYEGITGVKLRQTFSNVSVRLAQEPPWHGVTLSKLAFTPLEHHRLTLKLALSGRLEHPLLKLLAERLKQEMAVSIERADLLEEPKGKRITRAQIRRFQHTHAERTEPQ